LKLENHQKSGFYIVKFPNLLRLGLVCAPHFFDQKFIKCFIYMHSKPMEMFFLNIKDIYKTRSDILQGQALFRGVEQLLIREKKEKKNKSKKQ